MDGDRIWQDHQYEFRGFVFGGGTEVLVEGFEGLLSMPAVETDDLPNPHGHGTFSGIDRLTGRAINATLRPLGTKGANYESLIREMQSAFQSTREEYPLVWKRPGGIKLRVNCRCRRRDIPTSYELAMGMGTVELEFFATDPRVYSNTEYREDFQIAAGQTQATETIYMNGDLLIGTRPIIVIEGPTNDPVIANAADENKQIYINYNIPAGSTMEIDTARRDVKLNGVSIYGPDIVQAGTRWWSLLPGENLVTITRQNSNAVADVAIVWRDAFS